MSDATATDLRWLDAAARLATPVLGSRGTGPTVGVLVVDPATQRLAGRAITPPLGAGHPEELAIADAGTVTGCTLYATFEPQRPVTDAIASHGIARVVVGALDPDPELNGKGVVALVEAGVDVAQVEHGPSRLLNEGYAMRILKKRPFVTLKIVVSADGMVGHARQGELLPVGVEAQRFVERERAAADAILSGAARAEIEDNDLRVHLPGLDDRGALRVVLAGSRDLDERIELFTRASDAPVLVVTTPDKPLPPRSRVRTIEVEGRRGHPELRRVVGLLAQGGINRLLVESGARLAESFIASELIDRMFVIDSAVTVGRQGVPAALLGRFDDRLRAARYVEVDRRALGEDKVRTFERR